MFQIGLVLGFVKTISSRRWKIWTNQKGFSYKASSCIDEKKPTEKNNKAKLKLPFFNSPHFVLTHRCKAQKYTRPIRHPSFVKSLSAILCNPADKQTNQQTNWKPNKQINKQMDTEENTTFLVRVKIQTLPDSMVCKSRERKTSLRQKEKITGERPRRERKSGLIITKTVGIATTSRRISGIVTALWATFFELFDQSDHSAETTFSIMGALSPTACTQGG